MAREFDHMYKFVLVGNAGKRLVIYSVYKLYYIIFLKDKM